MLWCRNKVADHISLHVALPFPSLYPLPSFYPPIPVLKTLSRKALTSIVHTMPEVNISLDEEQKRFDAEVAAIEKQWASPRQAHLKR